MKILITGSSGLIGSKLIKSLESKDYEVIRLVRFKKQCHGKNIRYWQPKLNQLSQEALNGIDTVIHLAGERIDSRWSKEKKALIENSRVQSTKLLCNTMLSMKNPPKNFLSASAVGYYGDRGEEVLDENSKSGNTFLAQVCQDWEKAALPAVEKGIRVVNMRFGIVLSLEGGALARMIPPMRRYLGGIIGNGKQYISWISIVDVVKAIHHVIFYNEISGPVNIVSPQPVTNKYFTELLGKILHRPTLVTVPKIAIKTILGEMGKELLLTSARMEPSILKKRNFEFQHPDLESALRYLLN